MSDEGPAFVDTNVFVYSFDPTEPHRQQIAQALLDRLRVEDRLCLSTQILQEFYVTMTRKVRKGWTAEEAMAALDALSALPIVVVDPPLIRRAALLARAQLLSFWDSLMVVAAARIGAPVLYSEDLNHGQVIAGVQVVNPFLAA